MEIERKWMVNGWPENLKLINRQFMRQGYVTTDPTVRIREEVTFLSPKAPIDFTVSKDIDAGSGAKHTAGKTDYILCFKSHGDTTGMAREEIEIALSAEDFDRLEKLIALPLIPKERRTYLLADGSHLEVNHVDQGLPTEFWYAEVEFPDMDTASSWNPADSKMADYLNDEVTGQPGQSMAAYWMQTRVTRL